MKIRIGGGFTVILKEDKPSKVSVGNRLMMKVIVLKASTQNRRGTYE
jgi:hypothetical protein